MDPRGPHLCVDHELFEVPALHFTSVTLAFSLKAPGDILLNKLMSNQRGIRDRERAEGGARSKSLGRSHGRIGCSFEPLSYKLGVSDRVHSKGGVWEAGWLEGEHQLTVLGAEASTEVWIPSSVSAAYRSWSEQRNLMPSA